MDYESSCLRANRIQQITEILHKEIDLTSLASRYANSTLQCSSSIMDPDVDGLRLQVKNLLMLDPPSIVVKEMFGNFIGPENNPTDSSYIKALADMSHEGIQWSLPRTDFTERATPINSLSLSQRTYKDDSHDSASKNDPSKTSERVLPSKRLLELFHAATCKHDDRLGKCKISKHCKRVKKLWDHIETCQRKRCPFPHCRSSRALLSHYHRCDKCTCEMCDPVRRAARYQQNETEGTICEDFNRSLNNTFDPICHGCLSFSKFDCVCHKIDRLQQIDENVATYIMFPHIEDTV